MRRLALCATLLALSSLPPALVAGDAAPPTPPPVVDAAAAARLDAALEQAIAAGFPDARLGVLVHGKLSAVDKAPPEDDDGTPSGVMHFGPGKDVETSTADGKRTRTWDGLHLRLPGGRWLVELDRLLIASPDLVISAAADAVEVAPAKLREHLTKPGAADDDDPEEAKQYLDLFQPADRARLAATIATGKIYQHLAWNGTSPLPVIHLCRLGIPDAGALLMGVQAASLLPWMDGKPTAPLNLDANGYGGWNQDFNWNTWSKTNAGKLSLPPAEDIVRRLTAFWFRRLLLEPDELRTSGLEAAKAATAAKALLPEDRRQAQLETFDLLVARLALPATLPEKPDLAARMALWEPANRHGPGGDDGPEIPQLSAEVLAAMPAEQRTMFERLSAARSAWKPSEADLPGLLALLDDTRPSRWLDNTIPRTVGDNALRALARVLRFDPRLLVNRDRTVGWDAAERTTTATALRAWFAAQAGKKLADSLATAIGSLPPAAMIGVIAARPDDARTPLFDAIATAWSAKPPAGAKAEELAQVIGLAGDHAGMVAAIRRWPADPALRPLIAVWNDRRGQPEQLDSLIAELSAATPANDEAAGDLSTAIRQAARTPSTTRLQRFLALAGGPLDDSRTWATLGGALGNHGQRSEAWQAVDHLDRGDSRVRISRLKEQDEDHSHALPLALAAIFLADARVLPEGKLKFTAQAAWATFQLPGLHAWVQLVSDEEMQKAARAGAAGDGQAKRPDPTGLRVRDIAAVVAINNIWSLGIKNGHNLRSTRIDPWKPAEDRDRAMAKLVESVNDAARDALTAAKLPDVLPAAPAPAADKALF